MVQKTLKFPEKKSKVSKKKIIEKLRLKFPRVPEINKDVEIIPAEDGFSKVKTSSTLSDYGYVECGKISFQMIILSKYYLEHVIYRSLKTVYGFPDFKTITVRNKEINKKNDQMTGMPLDWGYLIAGEDGNLLEIIKKQNSHHPDMIIWLNLEKKPKKLPDSVLKNLQEFQNLFSQLVEVIDNDYSFKKEIEKADRFYSNGSPRCVINVYYQNLQAGKDILELSEEWVSEIDTKYNDLKNQNKWLESSNLHRKGSILYVSSIIYFLMAMEGFINLLYKFLIKPQFENQKEYGQIIRRNNLEMRILYLPFYCKGFNNIDFGPDDISYKEWQILRPFRNNLLHANITEENEFAITREDWFHFQYNPLFHLKRTKSKMNHTQQLYLRKNDVVKVQTSVEKFVSNIIEKMEESEKRWVKSWLDNLEIWYNGSMEIILPEIKK